MRYCLYSLQFYSSISLLYAQLEFLNAMLYHTANAITQTSETQMSLNAKNLYIGVCRATSQYCCYELHLHALRKLGEV